MPLRTRSKAQSGRSSAAALLAKCRICGSIPDARAISTASTKASSCRSVMGSSGSSALARCDHSPTISARPESCAVRAASKTVRHCERGTPLRVRPVSTLMCMRARLPKPPAAVMTSDKDCSLEMDRSTSAAMQSKTPGSPGAHNHAKRCPRSPVARSSRASDGRATPNHCAPHSRSVRATCWTPWP